MTTSPASSFPVSCPSVASTTAAGTMSHMARGFLSFVTRSSSDTDAVAPSASTAFTDSALRSNATHWCPVFCSRRTIFAPILPSPIIPSCIALAPRPRVFPNPPSALRQRLLDRRLQFGEPRFYVLAKVHTQRAPAAFSKHREVSASLCGLDNAESVFLLRHRKIVGIVARDL